LSCATPGLSKNATFIVDIDDVIFADLQADDLGTWKSNGTKSTHFNILPSGAIHVLKSTKYYRMTRRYYVHGTYSLYRRIIVDIQGNHLLFYN
jgi:hypothetical protein